MKKFASAITIALSLILAPTASAGISAQNSSEAAAFSSESFASIPERVQWMQENGMADHSPIGWLTASMPMSVQGFYISIYHWITAISGTIARMLAQ
ncbi:hypothetical protein CKALI_10745 [Corynebacterium kalinowskii]|uniref:Secreted protein n=1 Tax=Corynebacterium kalinowskii TaxID=2675216 RepID=A0A6B8VIZ4_9CORY|nr:hypothetical protein [Corynebacterium kalinowskii]QGU02999.1 hypothetical protein CKALI_10745 [Corynebacterium kalinowskii]